MLGIIRGRMHGAAPTSIGDHWVGHDFAGGYIFESNNHPSEAWSFYQRMSMGNGGRPGLHTPLVYPANYRKFEGDELRLQLSGQGARGQGKKFTPLGEQWYEQGADAPGIKAALDYAQEHGYKSIILNGATGIHPRSPIPFESKIAPSIHPTGERKHIRQIIHLADEIHRRGMKVGYYIGSIITPPEGPIEDPRFTYLQPDNMERLLAPMVKWLAMTGRADRIYLDWGNQAFAVLSEPPGRWQALHNDSNNEVPPIMLPNIYPDSPPAKKIVNFGWKMHEWLVQTFPQLEFVTEGLPPDERIACICAAAGIIGPPGSTHPHRTPMDEIPDRYSCLDEHFRPGAEIRWFITGQNAHHGITWSEEDVERARELAPKLGYAGIIVDWHIIN